jgi:hypothetical protein
VRGGATDFVRATTSGGDGRFSVNALPSGLYTIEVSAPGFASEHRWSLRLASGKSEDLSIALSVGQVTEDVTVSATLPGAAKSAPSQNSLLARSAQSVISNEFIRNFTSPVADYSQVIQMAPGTFSPGSAATIGPSTFGGSVNLLSRELALEQRITGSASYGSYSTRLMDAQYDSGTLGSAGRSRLLLDVHQMESDGYQTYNHQKRDAFSGKYQYATSSRTTLTAFSAIVDVHSNTPNTKGPTRAQVAQNGNNYLLSGDPAQPNYFGYNFYHIPTDFEYVGLKSSLGHGWSFDTKVYTYRYYNQQNFNSATTISATSAVDKLNSYRKVGNLLPLTQVSRAGVLRTGLWSEYAWTDRFQTPSDPRTWVDAALPNFHEKFGTTTLQPYAEYELRATKALRITPGIKLAYFKQDFTQFADNGKTVGNLNGAPFVKHAAAYRSGCRSRLELPAKWLEPRILQQACGQAVQRQRRRARGGRDRPLQHHEPLPQLHVEKFVPLCGEQDQA